MTLQGGTEHHLSKPEQLQRLLKENYGDDLRPSFLQAKFPSASGKQFTLPTADGDEQITVLAGIVVGHHPARAYWADAEIRGQPPDCSSTDGKLGTGTPGGNCKTCPFNAWGSDGRGRGKACKEMRRIYLLMDNRLVPIVITLPPTSLGAFQEYLDVLMSNGVRLRQVRTKLSIRTEKNPMGISYPVAAIRNAGELTPTEAQDISSMADALAPYLGAAPVTISEYIPNTAVPAEPDYIKDAPQLADNEPPHSNLPSPSFLDTPLGELQREVSEAGMGWSDFEQNVLRMTWPEWIRLNGTVATARTRWERLKQ